MVYLFNSNIFCNFYGNCVFINMYSYRYNGHSARMHFSDNESGENKLITELLLPIH